MGASSHRASRRRRAAAVRQPRVGGSTRAGAASLSSAVRAAEAWRRESDSDVIATRLEVELEAGWREQEKDYDGLRRVAAMVRHLAVEPTYAELVERRAS